MTSNANEDALRRELVEETLQECERLLADAEADALEARQTAQRHAQERAEGTVRALTAATERLHEEASSDRAAAAEAREHAQRHVAEAERLRHQIDAELRAATVARHDAEAALASANAEVDRLTAQAEARLTEAAELQARWQAELEAASHDTRAQRDAEQQEATERLQRIEAEVAERLASAEAAAAARLVEAEAAANTAAAQVLAEAQDAAAALLQSASTQRAAHETEASTADDARRADAAGASRLAAADRAAAERLAQADGEATRQLLDALEEAQRIVAAANAEAADIRRRAEARGVPAPPPPAPADDDAVSENAPDPPARRGTRRRARWTQSLRVLGFVVAALLVSALVRSFVAQPYTVAATSMEPELSDGDRVVLNRLAFELSDPERGDVVVFDTSDVPGAVNSPARTLVKRVIGLPGETVQGLDGQVVVDGEVIDDPSQGAPTSAFGPIEVPEGMLFVLGDNRALSVDSRIFGVVPIEVVIGRVEAVIWPPDQLGRV